MNKLFLSIFAVTLAAMSPVQAKQTTIAKDGAARAAIVVDAAVMGEDIKVANTAPHIERETETGRQRVRESVKDLAHYLGVISGGKFEILNAAPKDKRVAILIGKLGQDAFGPVGATDLAKQGHRVVIDGNRIGLYGESHLATSYAIYELLHRLGCRWYMPSQLGEHIPHQPTIALAKSDVSAVPSTLYRGIWYADVDYKRRNRMGGLLINAGHALEGYISVEQRKEHPEWRATIKGKPHDRLITWTRPEVREAIANAIIAQLDRDYSPSVSLSPDDNLGWDEAYDPQYDAGDMDGPNNTVSKTDRLLVLCNEVCERVGKKYPDVLFGMLAYVDYTRPPVREKVHPNLVPQIAPITYNRAHPMTHERHVNGLEVKQLVEGWGKKAKYVSHYWYGYNLAEVSAPTPFITKWGVDVPILLANNGKFWQPETMPNFETTMIGLVLGQRLSWDATQKPADIVNEIMTNFYGAAAEPMSKYWHRIDRAWIEGEEYSGSGYGYLRIFTPAVLKESRQYMDEAVAACKTATEMRRVQIANDSFTLLERFMKMRRDLADGKLAGLKQDADTWRGFALQLEETYRDQSCFGKRWYKTWPVVYFDIFFGHAYDDGSRIAADYKLLTANTPLRQWKYMVDKDKAGVAANWQAPAFDDSAWKSTDVGVETWSTIGHHSYFGHMWYRAPVAVPAVPAGKKVYLWIPSTDGSVKVFINGTHVPWVDAKGETKELFEAHATPSSYDITALVKAGADNQITLLCERTFFNELGTGGLLAPPMLYCEK